MNRTIEDICKEINELNIENISLDDKKQANQSKLNVLREEYKKLKNESLNDWYKNNPLQKYYKEIIDDTDKPYFREYYINIDDKLPDDYNRNIREMAESSVELNIEYIEIYYYRQGKMFSALYQDSTKVATWKFTHKTGNKPGEHGFYTAISKDEFDEIKKKVTEYINTKNK